ncbi:hypothetical protein CEXT_14891 [Caerostris extrusa]|uniref:Uncharacterized protein n=1 Tax=Caerostris extrusa TaxID=172846 RepID=A0AAV4STZ7_CAEEX|nr:hypothetical protein CEXT_14891 [Caerostris extrusa]
MERRRGHDGSTVGRRFVQSRMLPIFIHYRMFENFHQVAYREDHQQMLNNNSATNASGGQGTLTGDAKIHAANSFHICLGVTHA